MMPIRGYTIPADALAAIRQVMRLLPKGVEYSHKAVQVHLVLDTNVLVEDLRFLAKTCRDAGARTGIQELLASETVVAYYPAEAVPELEAKLDEIARRDGLDRSKLGTLWDQYRTKLHICPVGAIPVTMADDCRVLRDPTDLPFLALRHLLGANAIVTNDRDISAAGAPVIPPVHLRVDLRDLARAQGQHLAVIVGGIVVVGVPVVAVVAMIQGTAKAAVRLPPWLLALLGVGIVAVVLHPTSRAAIRSAAARIAHDLGEVWTQIEPDIQALLVAATEAGEESKHLAAALEGKLPGAVRPTLEQAAYRACVSAGRALTTAQVLAALRMAGTLDVTTSKEDVDAALAANPNMARWDDGRWTVLMKDADGSDA